MRTNTVLLLLATILVVACAYRLWSWYAQAAFGFDDWWDIAAPLAVAAIAYGSVLLNRRR